MSKPNNDKNNLVITITAFVVIAGMIAFGYQMYEHNTRVIEQSTSVDVPDNEDSSDEWIKNTGSNPCPILAEQKFDSNKSHYRCMYLK